jgi:hypothetical protein
MIADDGWEPIRKVAPAGGINGLTDYKARKETPIGTGVIDYFPDALAEVSKASLAGNKQHVPGTPLHWDKSKSADEWDALVRHGIERGKFDIDGVRHSAKMAWRALALLQREIDAERETPSVLNEHSVKKLVLGNGREVPAIEIEDYSSDDFLFPTV